MEPVVAYKERFVSDLTLKRAITRALADNPHVDIDEIGVEVPDGDAILRATVGGVIQRAESARTPGALPRIKAVDDRLRVRPLGSDGWSDADAAAGLALRITGVSQVRDRLEVSRTATCCRGTDPS
jgi:hypothetical protein